MKISTLISAGLCALILIACQNDQASTNSSNNKEVVKTGEKTSTKPDQEINYEGFQNSEGDVLYVDFQDAEKAHVKFRGEELILNQEEAASGILYTNEEYTLRQWQGETSLKRNEELIFKQQAKTLKGKLSIEGERQWIIDCNSGASYYLIDRTEKLKDRYDALSGGEAIYAIVKGMEKQISQDHKYSEFNHLLELVEIVATEKLEEDYCNQ